MGLDISVIRTPKSIDLEEIYALREVIENGFCWYLGDEKEKRAEKWKELKDKCQTLTKDDILKNISGPEDLVKCLNHISDSNFNVYLRWIVDSISDHEDGNTHLNFDYDKLPGTTILDSCSWNLYDLFKECRRDNRPLKPCGDFIREIDPYRVWVMGEKWNGKVLEFGIATWIGYFFQKIGYRILVDCLKDLKVNDPFVDFIDVKHYQESIRKVVKETMDTEDRLWLVASY
jgi:hypothetical protein